MYPCANTETTGGGSVEFCCGHMATNVSICCANGGAFSVPEGQIVLRPDQLSSYLASSTSISAASVSTPSTPYPTLSTSSSPSGQSSQVSSENKKSLAIGLGVGLGVGIPFLLLLIGALVFLGFQLKRQNQNRASPDGVLPVAGEALPMTNSYLPVVEMEGRQRTGVRSELESQNQQVYEVPDQGKP
jgi:hypothetical protein